jgi:hypothetical protein
MQQLLEKRVQLILSFAVRVNDITEESTKENLKRYGNYQDLVDDPATWELAATERRLLMKLLENEEVLARLLNKCILQEVEMLGDCDLQKKAGMLEREEEILAPVLATLDEDDALFFQDVIEEELFWENTELLWDSLQAELQEVALVEVEVPG